MALDDLSIGFIGGGAMAEALLGGLLASGAPAERLCAADPESERRERLARELGVTALENNAAVVERADVVVLAVKPNVVTPVLAALEGVDTTRPLWISIAAGVTLASLEAGLSAEARIVRAMPNTPALIRSGATALCGNARVGDAERAAARALFESVGIVWEAPREVLLDAVTALSGSGPAYVFAFLEALIDAGEAQGLPRDAAEALAFQTVTGAARLAQESEHSPAELRRRVSSPGGTTLAGLAQLEARDFAGAIRDAVAAAARRAAELGRGE